MLRWTRQASIFEDRCGILAGSKYFVATRIPWQLWRWSTRTQAKYQFLWWDIFAIYPADLSFKIHRIFLPFENGSYTFNKKEKGKVRWMITGHWIYNRHQEKNAPYSRLVLVHRSYERTRRYIHHYLERKSTFLDKYQYTDAHTTLTVAVLYAVTYLGEFKQYTDAHTLSPLQLRYAVAYWGNPQPFLQPRNLK